MLAQWLGDVGEVTLGGTIEPMSVFEWFETDGLISQRRDWLIGFKV